VLDLPKTLTFRCPACREYINTDMAECRFCSAPVDPAVARQLAERQRVVNAAVSDAGNLRAYAGTCAGAFLVSFLPLARCVAFPFFLVTAIILPVLFIRWQVRYGSVSSSDEDFREARRKWLVALGLWAAPVTVYLMFLAASVFM
jgi:hypothetical protein